MFETTFHRLDIWRRQAAQRRVDRHYKARVEKIKKANGPFKEYQPVLSEWSHEREVIEDEILRRNGVYLIQQADRLFLPSPKWTPDSADWELSDITNGYRLTQATQHALQKEIRKEKKEAAELWLMWVPFMSFAIAILSLCIAGLSLYEQYFRPQPPAPLIVHAPVTTTSCVPHLACKAPPSAASSIRVRP